MFEIFYGSDPLGNFTNEMIEIYKEILYKEITFPSDNEKVKFVNTFIKDLLTKKVNLRIYNLLEVNLNLMKIKINLILILILFQEILIKLF